VLDSSTSVTLDSTTGSSVVATGVAAGTARVLLTVSDSRGVSATAVSQVTVQSSTSSGDGGSSSGSSGGGGGAANPAWLVALALAGLLLRPRVTRAPWRARTSFQGEGRCSDAAAFFMDEAQRRR
jgi:hypothetical protein